MAQPLVADRLLVSQRMPYQPCETSLDASNQQRCQGRLAPSPLSPLLLPTEAKAWSIHCQHTYRCALDLRLYGRPGAEQDPGSCMLSTTLLVTVLW